MQQPYLTRTTCRVCGSDNLTELFSLGEQYVSDFVAKDKVCAGHKVPITLDLCNACTLVQARHSLPAGDMYGQQYWYRSGTTETMRKALADVVRAAKSVVNGSGMEGLVAGDVVLDIGSNDGTLLRFWGDGLVRVGVEPAPNLVESYERDGLVLVNDLWSIKAYMKQAEKGCGIADFGVKRAKVITACGMFYDLEDPNQFIADVAKVLHPEGVFITQLMCLKQTVELCDVGNFAHEHLEFYSLRSLERLFSKNGLVIFDIEENTVNGGSYRIFAQHRGTPVRWIDGAVDRVIAAFNKEAAMGLDRPSTYHGFFADIYTNQSRVMAFIKHKFEQGKRIMVYGASTKGNVILQWYGLHSFWSDGDGLTVIDYAADRDPAKHGLYTVGTGILIISEEEARRLNPDYFLVLPYAFLDEFLVREKEWRDGGGKFIVPLPEFRII